MLYGSILLYKHDDGNKYFVIPNEDRQMNVIGNKINANINETMGYITSKYTAIINKYLMNDHVNNEYKELLYKMQHTS